MEQQAAKAEQISFDEDQFRNVGKDVHQIPFQDRHPIEEHRAVAVAQIDRIRDALEDEAKLHRPHGDARRQFNEAGGIESDGRQAKKDEIAIIVIAPGTLDTVENAE